MLRRTIAEINLDSIQNNLKEIKKTVGENVKILLPVKADAYGHGSVEISGFVQKNNLADMLGVASLDEGIELRNAGIKLPILVLSLILPEEKMLNAIIDFNLTQTVADYSLAETISIAAEKRKKTATIHLKIDTGMGRIGCPHKDAFHIIKKIKQLKNIYLEGMFSHFPVADEIDRQFTENQILKFKKIISDLHEHGLSVPLNHIANSAGIMEFPDSYLDMVRPGIISYGYKPDAEIKMSLNLKPSMTLKSKIIFSKKVSKNTPLSYGLTYLTENETNIATIPVGYGDGYNRLLSNKANVLIKGKTYPVTGRVTMDHILVNTGDEKYLSGEEVILFGEDTITANDIAMLTNTIAYEVTCNISKRVPRIYKNNGVHHD